jgi:hypothetical protein
VVARQDGPPESGYDQSPALVRMGGIYLAELLAMALSASWWRRGRARPTDAIRNASPPPMYPLATLE